MASCLRGQSEDRSFQSKAFSVWNVLRFKPYGLAFRGKNAVFPLGFGRAALCRRAFAFFKRKMR